MPGKPSMDRKRKPAPGAQAKRDVEPARERSRIADAGEPRALHAQYNEKTGRLEIELNDGCLVAIPTGSMQGLRGASDRDIARVTIAGGGYALHWDEIDVHFTVAGLLAGHIGSRIWMREHARKAGTATSAAKARAARRNGRKGGRPRGAAKKAS